MNKERCLLLKEIVADLERTEGRLRKIWVEEERNYDQRTLATKETDQGVRSKEAIEQLEQASDSIEKACEAIRQVIESPDF
jgi:molecular chaperone GrpE (heat shock protein)